MEASIAVYFLCRQIHVDTCKFVCCVCVCVCVCVREREREGTYSIQALQWKGSKEAENEQRENNLLISKGKMSALLILEKLILSKLSAYVSLLINKISERNFKTNAVQIPWRTAPNHSLLQGISKHSQQYSMMRPLREQFDETNILISETMIWVFSQE